MLLHRDCVHVVRQHKKEFRWTVRVGTFQSLMQVGNLVSTRTFRPLRSLQARAIAAQFGRIWVLARLAYLSEHRLLSTGVVGIARQSRLQLWSQVR
jgi:hypothetical protein